MPRHDDPFELPPAVFNPDDVPDLRAALRKQSVGSALHDGPEPGARFYSNVRVKRCMRWGWPQFAIMLAIGLAVSAISWYFGNYYGFFFLLLPFMFPVFRFGGRDQLVNPIGRTCSVCGLSSRDDDIKFCPRDGTLLK